MGDRTGDRVCRAPGAVARPAGRCDRHARAKRRRRRGTFARGATRCGAGTRRRMVRRATRRSTRASRAVARRSARDPRRDGAPMTLDPLELLARATVVVVVVVCRLVVFVVLVVV